jgi:hypothetical protein
VGNERTCSEKCRELREQEISRINSQLYRDRHGEEINARHRKPAVFKPCEFVVESGEQCGQVFHDKNNSSKFCPKHRKEAKRLRLNKASGKYRAKYKDELNAKAREKYTQDKRPSEMVRCKRVVKGVRCPNTFPNKNGWPEILR